MSLTLVYILITFTVIILTFIMYSIARMINYESNIRQAMRKFKENIDNE